MRTEGPSSNKNRLEMIGQVVDEHSFVGVGRWRWRRSSGIVRDPLVVCTAWSEHVDGCVQHSSHCKQFYLSPVELQVGYPCAVFVAFYIRTHIRKQMAVVKHEWHCHHADEVVAVLATSQLVTRRSETGSRHLPSFLLTSGVHCGVSCVQYVHAWFCCCW